MIRRLGFVLAIIALVSGAGLLLRAEPPQEVGTWASIGTAPENRIGAAAVALPDGRTLIVGGLANGTPTDAVVVFDPADSSFATAGQLLEPRAGHTATLLEDGRVLIAGGTVNELLSGDLEIFDPSTGTSTLTATMAELRTGHAAARIGDDKVLIAGGTGTDGVLQTAEIFDPNTGAASLTGSPLTVGRTGASATALIDGRVLIAGGNNGSQDLASAEIYNPSTDSFQSTDTNLDAPRSNHAAVLLPYNNSVLIAGGTSDGVPLATADLFLPAQFPDPFTYGMGQFALTGEMAAPRSGAAGGPHIEGYAFVVGGGQPDAEVYRFATIKTDKDDYAPGEPAVITGSGWEANEEVTLLFQEDPAVHADYVLSVTADGEGNIYWDQWAPEQHDLGVRFYLMATGSRSRAQTSFTDGNRVRFSTDGAATNVFPLALSSVTPNQCVTLYVQEQQGSNASTAPVDRVVTLSSTPAGATFYSSTDCTGGPIPSVTITSGFFSKQFSFSIAVASATPYTINGDTAFSGDNDARATITVAATSVATTTSINAPPITYGQNGSVTVTVSPNSGSSTPTGNVSLSVDGATAVTKSLVSGSATFTGADVPELVTPSAGDHSLSASYAGATGFDPSGPTAGTLTVDPADLTISAGNRAKTYGDTVTFDQTTPSTDFTVVGLLNADTVDSITLTSAGAVNTATVAGSPYDIVPSAAVGTGLGNYDIAYVKGALTVDPADLTISAVSRSKTYGDTVTFDQTTPSTDFTVVGLLNADTVDSITLTSAGAVNTATVAGSPYDIVPSAAVGTGLGNYDIAYVKGVLTVNKANATFTVTPYNVAYDGNPHTATVSTITGVNGETGATVGVVNVSGTVHTLPGSYTDPWTFTGTANYNDAAGTVNDVIGYGTCSPGYGPGGVILQPINSDGTSVYPRKGGSTIPVKFTVCDASGLPISNPAAVFAGTIGQLTMLSAVRGTVTVINEDGDPIAIPDAAFRWAGDKWIFNMATSNLTQGNTYKFRINLALGYIDFVVGVK